MRFLSALFLTVNLAMTQDAPDKQIQDLIQALNDDSKPARDKAVDDLVKIGPAALEALRKAADTNDPEVKSLAETAIDRIQWGRGVERLKAYAKDRLANKDPKFNRLELKTAQRWFPNTRFYELEEAAQPGMAGGGRMGVQSGGMFAIRKDEDTFYRIAMKGIIAKRWLIELLKKEDVRLACDEDAFDFAVASMELYWRCMGANNSWAYTSYGSDFVKTADGWELQSPNYGTRIVFKADKEGRLIDIVFGAGQNYNYAVAEEKNKLEIEKLKLELEVLKRQLR